MRLRLLLSFTLVVLVSVASVVFLTRQGAVSEVRTFMVRGGMADVANLVELLEEHYAQNGTWAGVQRLLRLPHGQGRGSQGAMMGTMMDQRLRVADSTGSVVADSATPPEFSTLTAAELEQAIPLQAGGKTAGYLLAEGGMTFSSSDEAFLIRRLNRAALIAGLVGGGLALLLSLLLAGRLLQPIRALTGLAGRMAQGDLSQRAQVQGTDELARLGRAFNEMASSLEQAQASRRAMTADIAHELRNPLSIQRAHLEALQDGIYPFTAENLEPVLQQNLLLTRLVEDLHTLALAEAGQLSLDLQPVDLTTLVQESLERFRPQADERDIRLEAELQPLPPLRVDPQRIEQILGNLLSNALRHTPDGGRVRVRLQPDCERVFVSVHDSGPGIPEEALEKIFERFYRADRARSRSQGGAGLGLSIARNLAQAHGGTLRAANHPQGGAVFTLELPAAGLE